MLGNILAVGLMSMGMGLSGVKDEPNMYAQDEATYTITYESKQDLIDKFNSIYNALDEGNYKTASSALSITGTFTAETDSTTIEDSVVSVYVNYVTGGNTYKSLRYYKASGTYLMINVFERDGYTELTWSAPGSSGAPSQTPINDIELTITGETYYNLTAEPEPNMGNDIIGTIASGLGIIGALATTFLTGFGNLFYAEGALTPFAIFALVMLGIAVSFAVVKLVLNLIRSNTGA